MYMQDILYCALIMMVPPFINYKKILMHTNSILPIQN